MNKKNNYFNKLDEATKISIQLFNCNKKNCNKKLNAYLNNNKKIYKKIHILNEKEKKTLSYKKFILNGQKISNKYKQKKVVILYNNNLKNGIPNDKKTIEGNKKEFKILHKNIRKNLNLYLKTKEKKYYINEINKLYDKMRNTDEFIDFINCSAQKCLELHKKDLILLKKYCNTLCKKNNKDKTNCKIDKIIDVKLDINKFNYDDVIKIKKKIYKYFI
tara:strand:+ start:107 stop:760 length:654 start_codon:yes stop_codon:yes gene_type:complete